MNHLHISIVDMFYQHLFHSDYSREVKDKLGIGGRFGKVNFMAVYERKKSSEVQYLNIELTAIPYHKKLYLHIERPLHL